MSAPPPLRILFSDIDGTCVHYPDTLDGCATVADACGADGLWAATSADGAAAELLLLPPSSTGTRGAISARSLRLYAAVRALGVPLVIISGCRAATLLQRLPCLPAADAYVCESGGRIFYPSAALPTAAPLEEDLEWRRSLEAVAGSAAEAGPPAERPGALWACFARLQAAGFACDAASYTTAFRLRGSLAEVRPLLPPELAAAENLKHVDVYPAASGKRNAALHLMRRFGAAPAAAAFLCDDDNDLELAAAVGAVYLPTVTAPSVRAAVEAAPAGKFYVARAAAVWATEECLELVLQRLAS